MKEIFKTVILVSATLCGMSPLWAESVTSVLTSPAAYQHKRVTLEGIVRGDTGPLLDLYATPADAVSMKPSRSIRIVVPDGWKKEGPYDLRRISVTGIIDARQHGTWGNPCSLLLEKLKVLSGPVAPWSDVALVFKNESAVRVLIFLETPPFRHSFELRPAEYAWRYTTSSGSARATSHSGSLVGNIKVTLRPRTPYYDAVNAASYYRITDRKIEQVLPIAAKEWGWRR